jgi:PAS domain S-box-containing protein
MTELPHLFESHPQPMLVYDTASLRILAANEAAVAEYGYPRGEFLSMDLLALHPAEDRAAAERFLEPIRAGNLRGFRKVARSGFRHVRKDGSRFEVETSGQPIEFEGRNARVLLVRDVSDQRRVRELQERYDALFENARDIVLFVSTGGRILDANRTAERAYGYTREELTKMKISDLREPSTRGDVRSKLARAASSEGVFFETLHRRRDGSSFPVEVRGGAVTIAGRRMLLSVIRDTTERKRAQEELRRSVERFRLLVERSPEGVALCREGKLVYVNPVLTGWLGAEEPAILETQVVERFASENRTALEERLSARPGDPDAPEQPMTLLRADGRKVGVAVAAHAVEIEGEPGVLLLVREVGGALHPAAPAPAQHEPDLAAPLAAAQKSLEEARVLWKRGPSGMSPQEAAARVSAALEEASVALAALAAAARR